MQNVPKTKLDHNVCLIAHIIRITVKIAKDILYVMQRVVPVLQVSKDMIVLHVNN